MPAVIIFNQITLELKKRIICLLQGFPLIYFPHFKQRNKKGSWKMKVEPIKFEMGSSFYIGANVSRKCAG
jgi:hypothetical protein